ncbi:MAG: galactokinase [Acidimicrobiales bacterium]
MSAGEAFRQHTGREPEGVWSAPGRVNLIGEHTDYNDGCVLPFALPLRTVVAAGRRHDGMLSIWSCQHPGQPVRVPVDTLAPGAVSGWAAYVAGVVWSLRTAEQEVGGLDIVIDGGVPSGSGLSSSAAMECAVALAAADLHDLVIPLAELARHAQRAENDFVGMPCGPMDQMVSMTATAGHALFFDTRSGATEHMAFDPSAAGLTLLVINTHVEHAHMTSSFAQRRRSCTLAAKLLGLQALRDIPLQGLNDALLRLAGNSVLAGRVRHVVTENARTLVAAELLRAGRIGEIGPLLTASHASLRDDYEVSAPELDAVVEVACHAGALGARMTGGGFGGCAIALVAEEQAAEVIEAVTSGVRGRRMAAPTVLVGVPSAGAHREADLATRSRWTGVGGTSTL